MNNNLYKDLDIISRENEIRAKVKKQKEQEIVRIVKKLFNKETNRPLGQYYFSALDYLTVCEKNNQLIF